MGRSSSKLGIKRATLAMLLSYFLFAFGIQGVDAQDTHFSQFRTTPVFLNPSTAGSFKGDIRALGNYKNQWASLGNPYQSFAFSLDGKLFQNSWDGSHLGVGGFAYSDQAGDAGFGITRGKLAVSYNLALNSDNYIAAGIQGGYEQISFDRGALKWGSQYDGTGHNPKLPSGEKRLGNSSSTFDLGAGIDWRIFSERATVTGTEGYWVEAGAAVHHLTRPKHSLYKEKIAPSSMKFVGHVDASLGIAKTNIAVLPGVMFAKQGPSYELVYGSRVRYQFQDESHFTGANKGAALSLGIHNRWGDALIGSLFLEYSRYALGVSYDVNVSDLNSATGGQGGFEIALRFMNPNPFTSGSPGGMPSF